MCVHTKESAATQGQRLADNLLNFIDMSTAISGHGIEAARKEIEESAYTGYSNSETRKKLLGILDSLAETIGVATPAKA